MITYYTANNVLSAMFGRSSGASIASSAYLGLSKTEPAPDGTNVTEPSGNGYQRVFLGTYGSSLTQKMGAPSQGRITNSEEIHFNKSTGAWLNGDSIPYAVLYSAQTGGTLVAYMDLQTAINVTGANVVPVISLGDLVFEFDYPSQQVGE